MALGLASGVLLSAILAEAVPAQGIKLFQAERKSGYLEINSFSDKLSRDWSSLRGPLRDNELGVGTSLYLNYVGSIYHRRLVEWNADGRVTLKKRRFTNSTINITEKFSEYLQDYTLGATIFKDRNISARFFATRNTSTADADFSASSNVNTRGYGGSLSFIKGRLVQILSARKNKYASDGIVNVEEKRSVVIYDASFRKNKLTSTANYEYNDIEFVTSGASFNGHSVRVQNYFNLDERGKHTFSLGGNYFERNAASSNKNGQIGIGTHQQITSSLESSGSFSFRRNEVERSTSETNSISGNASHRLYQSLISTFTFDGYRTIFNQGSEREYNPRANFSYRKTTFFGALRMRYLLGYRKHDERFNQGAYFAPRQRQDEFEFLPGAPLILSAVALDTLSIVVTSPDSSALFSFLNGVHYEIVETGSRIEIIILLTGGVQFGDSLLVTYTEQFSPDKTNASFVFEEVENRYGVTLEFTHGFQLSADRVSQRQILLSGLAPNQLDDTRADQVVASWRFKDARLKAEYQRRRTVRNPFKTRSLSGQLSRGIARRMTISTSTTYSVTDFTDQTGRSKLITVNSSLWRRFSPYLNSRMRLSFLKRIGRRDDGESWVLSSITRYNVRLLLGELRIDYYDRQVDLVGDENRFSIKLSIKRQL